MSYWWVNHKRTFSAEVGDGYIWSPETNKNGSKNQTYINLTFAKPGDIVFSYAKTQISAIGLVTSNYVPEKKPVDFGKAGEVWAESGWKVPVSWLLLSNPLKPKEHIAAIAPLLPTKYSPIQANGNGNQGCYLASISDEMGALIIRLIQENNDDVTFGLSAEQEEIQENMAVLEIEHQSIPQTEKEQLIKSRVGQGEFRSNVMKLEKKCRVTQVANAAFLIASHIKPWKNSDNLERLNGHNGLLLAPHIDRLFDRGWISFQDNGDMLVSSVEVGKALTHWGISLTLNVGAFTDQQKLFMQYHRDELFAKKKIKFDV